MYTRGVPYRPGGRRRSAGRGKVRGPGAGTRGSGRTRPVPVVPKRTNSVARALPSYYTIITPRLHHDTATRRRARGVRGDAGGRNGPTRGVASVDTYPRRGPGRRRRRGFAAVTLLCGLLTPVPGASQLHIGAIGLRPIPANARPPMRDAYPDTASKITLRANHSTSRHCPFPVRWGFTTSCASTHAPPALMTALSHPISTPQPSACQT